MNKLVKHHVGSHKETCDLEVEVPSLPHLQFLISNACDMGAHWHPFALKHKEFYFLTKGVTRV